MRKTILLLVLSLFTVALVYSTASAQTAALYILTNVCKVTANNLGPIAAPTDITNVTTRTMFGGIFSSLLPTMRTQTAAAGGGVIWTFDFTNKGNATTTFKFDFQSVASNLAGTTWKAVFQNGQRSNVQTLVAGQVLSVQVCITDRLPIQSDGSFYRLRVMASNTKLNITTANGATNYIGDNGIAYGGTMGDDWTGITTLAAQKCVFIEQGLGYDGFLTLLINAPLLGITKTIQSITRGGFASAPIPGATIQYKIVVTNGGGADAINTRLWDTTPAGTVIVFGKTVAMTNLVGLDTNVSGGLNPSGFVWTNGALAANTGRAVVIYQVRIQ